MPRHLTVADAIETFAFSHNGALAVGAGTLEVPVPYDFTVVKVLAHAKTAPAGASASFDVLVNGTSALNTHVSIPDGAQDGVSTDVAAASYVAGNVLRVDITGAGTTTPGSDVVVSVLVARTIA